MRRGLISGCLLVGANALVALSALAVILSLHRSGDDASEAQVAPPRPAAQAAASTPKLPDRLPSSDPRAGTSRLWKTKAEQSASNAPMGEGGLWRQGEASLRLEASGRVRRFFLVDRRGDGSANDGDLAFDGVREGRVFSGLALAYAQGCEPLSYPVRGSITADETTISLRGAEPLRDARCNVVGATDRELVFSRSGAQFPVASWTAQAE